jgi:acetyltransferase-like isoleucine patch superfamily enzyme
MGAPIIIGEYVWLGVNVVVLAGVKIGDGAVLAAGSVVTKSVPSGQLWGGVPARLIREVA